MLWVTPKEKPRTGQKAAPVHFDVSRHEIPALRWLKLTAWDPVRKKRSMTWQEWDPRTTDKSSKKRISAVLTLLVRDSPSHAGSST